MAKEIVKLRKQMKSYIVGLHKEYVKARKVSGQEPLAMATISKLVANQESRWLKRVHEGQPFTLDAFEKVVDNYAKIWPTNTTNTAPFFEVELRTFG